MVNVRQSDIAKKLGIVVPDLENRFFSYIVDGMIDYATEHNIY